MKKNSKNKRSANRNPVTIQGASYAPSTDTAVQNAGNLDTAAPVQEIEHTNCPAEHIVLQFENNEIEITEITEKVKKSFLDSNNDAEIKTLDIYVKPEDNRAYYVINSETEGSIELVEN